MDGESTLVLIRSYGCQFASILGMVTRDKDADVAAINFGQARLALDTTVAAD
jgi:hypothetical protein